MGPTYMNSSNRAITPGQMVEIDYLPDFKEVAITIWRHRLTLLATMAAITLVGSVFILFKTNTYDAAATIMVKDNNVNLKNFQEINGGLKTDNTSIQTEVKVLMSPTLALKTIEDAKLYETEEFRSSTGDAKGSLAKFMKNVSVSQQASTRVIQISFRSEDPELAAKVANAHVDAYLKSQIDTKTERIEGLRSWFEERVQKLKTDVVNKSKAAGDYRAANNLIVDQDDQELIYKHINDASSKISAAQTLLLDTEAKLSAVEALKDADDPNAIAAIVNSQLIQRLKTEVSESAQEASELRGRFGARHPLVLAANNKLGQAQSSLADETLKIKDTLSSDAIAKRAEIEMLEKHLAALEKEANDMRAKMIVYKGLRLEQQTSQRLLDTFLANFEDIQNQENLARSDASIVSPAVAPSSPSAPGKFALLIGLMFASGCVGLGIIFIKETSRGGISNFEDIRKFGYKPMGILPDIANPIYVASSPQNSGYKEALKRIYMTGLLSAEGQSILVTSALPKEGRTTFTLSMAHYMRSIGHSVLVIDADFMNPTISFSEGNVKAAGFTDYLAGQAELSEIVTKNDAGLYIMKAGRQQLSSPDVLRSARFSGMMADLKKQYNFILIDSSPLLAHAESEVIAGKVDGVIVVTEWMKTSHPNVANVAITLGQVNAHVIGLAINRVDIERYKSYTTGSDFLLPNMTRADFS